VNKKEELLIAEIDMAKIYAGKWILDTAGHYARPDVFKFSINKTKNQVMGIHEDEFLLIPETEL
jgi:nitrilase